MNNHEQPEPGDHFAERLRKSMARTRSELHDRQCEQEMRCDNPRQRTLKANVKINVTSKLRLRSNLQRRAIAALPPASRSPMTPDPIIVASNSHGAPCLRRDARWLRDDSEMLEAHSALTVGAIYGSAQKDAAGRRLGQPTQWRVRPVAGGLDGIRTACVRDAWS